MTTSSLNDGWWDAHRSPTGNSTWDFDISHSMKPQLPHETMIDLSAMMAEATRTLQVGDRESADQLVLRSWEALPEPKMQWGYTGALIADIVAYYIAAGDAAKALHWVPKLFEAYSQEDPGSHMLYGRALLLDGDAEKAKFHFREAYRLGGARSFSGEAKQFLELVQPRKSRSKRKPTKVKPAGWPLVPDPEAYKLMAGPLQLEEDVLEKIQRLCADGDALSEQKKYDAAIEKYREALFMVPRPLEKWDASTWIYAAIGDAMFRKGDFLAAAEPLRAIMYCQGAQENGFIRLRRGQVAFEKGNLAVAEKELAAAYSLEGERIFDGEHPKYWEFIKPKLQSLS